MFGSEHHVSRAIKCVGPGREDANGSVSVPLAFFGLRARGFRYSKIDLRAFAASNTISLEQFDPFGPFESVQFIQQSLRVGCDAQHPLSHRPSDDRETANLAF